MNPFLKIKSILPSLYKVERKIAEYILENPENVIKITTRELSKKLNIAESSIVRFSKGLGFNGFTELKVNVAKYLVKEEKRIIDVIDKNDTYDIIAEKIFNHSINILKDTKDFLDKDRLNETINAISSSSDIVVFGSGSSYSIAFDLCFKLNRLGINARISPDAHMSYITTSNLGKNSLFIGISHSGRTKNMVDTMKIAKTKGAKIINISSIEKSNAADLADINLLIASTETGPLNESLSSQLAMEALVNIIYISLMFVNDKEYMKKGEENNLLVESFRY